MARQKAETRSRNPNRDTSHKGSSPKVVTRWQHTTEHSPAFGQLMMLLLKDRSEKSGVEKKDRLS
jgi:hypothetical protein